MRASLLKETITSLLKAGVSVPVALAFEAAIVALRFVIRPWILPLVLRIGLRRTLILVTGIEWRSSESARDALNVRWKYFIRGLERKFASNELISCSGRAERRWTRHFPGTLSGW